MDRDKSVAFTQSRLMRRVDILIITAVNQIEQNYVGIDAKG